MNLIMKKYLLVGVGIVFCYQLSIAQRVVTSEDYNKAVNYLGPNMAKMMDRGAVIPNWLHDGNFWYRVNTPNSFEYVLVDAKTGSKKIFPAKAGLGLPEKKSEPEAKEGEVLSPDGKKAAFIKDWNLWIRDVTSNQESALTTDGAKDFGYATDNAGWKHSHKAILLWSPDSKKIATFIQDQRHVKDMYLVKTTVGAPELSQWKYPLPGDKEIIKIHRVIIDLTTSSIIKLKTAADDRRSTLCDDISCDGSFDDNEWSADGIQLAFVSTPRDHKKATLRIANALTGEVRDIFEEVVATQYESGQGTINWKFMPKTNEFIWYSEKDNWGHLYLHDLKTGQLKNRITAGNYVVTQVLHVDEEKRILYFEGRGKETGRNPYFKNYYKVDFSGKNLALLTPEEGDHTIILSPDKKYFIDNYSQVNVPNVAILKGINGKVILSLERADISRLLASGWKAPIPISVKSAANEFDLYGFMYQPSNLDVNKKYPVINYIYPGPQGGSVGNWSFGATRASDHQALAELGFIVVAIEGSCNTNRSKAFHDACYGNMAENTLPDQISGLKQLQQKYPYLDLDRVGVWGHSGGGYATAAALFNYPDFYKVGISESGNHDMRNYEDDWGERYIGLLQLAADNKSNYEIQANQINAKNLTGHLMLAHGNMDDNVPPYNTYLVVEALEKANKDFDLIIFPNARHGYGSDSYYMMRRRWDYFVTHLLGATPPKEYQLKVIPDPRNKD
jgi:dipeptidyl aminopeptidase/acylaminoacyl peptidase